MEHEKPLVESQNINYDKFLISIVMAYYNRKPQLIKTLNQLEINYKNYNFEVVIVDDNSDENNKLDDVIKNYSIPINLIVISKEDKGDRINSSVAYNLGFKAAKGKIIIIQNPECYHVGNILSKVSQMDEYTYLTFSCYSTANYAITEELLNFPEKLDLINDPDFTRRNSPGNLIWYNHPNYNPVGYHFCTAIYKSKLNLIGGFDERFGDGYCFDDNELLLTIRHNLKLNIKIVSPDEGFVIHQYHEKKYVDNNWKILWDRNKKLYDDLVASHTTHRFNYPKILHLYWDGSPMSFLNYITVLSFNRYHKGWKIVVHTPTSKSQLITWNSYEQQLRYNGTCYFDKLKNIHNVIIQPVDLDKIGFYNDASEVIKSDYFRYYILHHHGGVWSDFDIIYTGSIEEKMNFNQDAVIFRCESNGLIYYPIGLLISKPNNKFYKHLMTQSLKFYHPGIYQSIGALMWKSLFPTIESFIGTNLGTLYLCNHVYYLPWAWDELDNLVVKKENTLPINNIGIHWFNGASETKKYAIDLDKRILNYQDNKVFDITCYLDTFVKDYIN
jgi:hypothetical protein